MTQLTECVLSSDGGHPAPALCRGEAMHYEMRHSVCRSFNVTGGRYATVHACQSDDVRRRVVFDLRRGNHRD
jgi:hypothetical protein